MHEVLTTLLITGVLLTVALPAWQAYGFRIERAAALTELQQAALCQAKRSVWAPVSSAEPWHVWLDHPELVDAVVIVVSEETGMIAVVVGGKITRDLEVTTLKKVLNRLLEPRRLRGKKT